LLLARLEVLARDKHCSLLSPFISYEKNKVFRIRTKYYKTVNNMVHVIISGCVIVSHSCPYLIFKGRARSLKIRNARSLLDC